MNSGVIHWHNRASLENTKGCVQNVSLLCHRLLPAKPYGHSVLESVTCWALNNPLIAIKHYGSWGDRGGCFRIGTIRADAAIGHLPEGKSSLFAWNACSFVCLSFLWCLLTVILSFEIILAWHERVATFSEWFRLVLHCFVQLVRIDLARPPWAGEGTGQLVLKIDRSEYKLWPTSCESMWMFSLSSSIAHQLLSKLTFGQSCLLLGISQVLWSELWTPVLAACVYTVHTVITNYGYWPARCPGWLVGRSADWTEGWPAFFACSWIDSLQLEGTDRSIRCLC